ncbi:hypothetical protein GCM10010123_02070 [Pilimelia anulata]|uniref:Uncharacterized protein n=1 Tax=Pilimelia anulata TaxID=53371 RepID=A0A8J3B6B6_9ACTN|nr:hypothetical protein [Pilimelia anulata]GGJ75655.1 hypothetical protein GCM10010123_02070 [Pilimelia anulata]
MNRLQLYRRERADGVRAVLAWRRATEASTVPAWATSLCAEQEWWRGEVDGWQVSITTVIEDCPDISWLGEFTDDPAGAVPNPEYQHGRYRYFRPATPPTRDALWNAGVARRDIGRQLHEIAVENARLALEPHYMIRIEVERDDGPSGVASIGGVLLDGFNEVLWLVHEHQLITEAIESAREAHARQCGKIAAVCRGYGHEPESVGSGQSGSDGLRPRHCDGTPDGRYTVTPEWCGWTHPAPGLPLGQAWVARWCGQWLAATATATAAWAACRGHQCQRGLVRPPGSARFVGVFGYAYRTADGWTGATLADCPTVEFVTASGLTEARQMARRMPGVGVGDVIHTGGQIRTVTELLIAVYEVRP